MEDGVQLPLEDVRRELGDVSEATIRRYSRLYEKVFEALPVDKRGTRMYTRQAINRMHAARQLQKSGKAGTFEQALFALRSGENGSGLQVGEVEHPDVLRVIHESLLHLEAQVIGLRQENVELRKRLEALPAPEPNGLEELRRQNRVIHEDLLALASGRDDEVGDLKKRLDYALGELQRRDRETARPKRWRFW